MTPLPPFGNFGSAILSFRLSLISLPTSDAACQPCCASFPPPFRARRLCRVHLSPRVPIGRELPSEALCANFAYNGALRFVEGPPVYVQRGVTMPALMVELVDRSGARVTRGGEAAMLRSPSSS